ncbi:efflux RND transporter permease subunit, partial [Singulisphaera rosea]
GLVPKLQAKMASVRDAMVIVLQPPPIRGLSQTGGFELMIEDRSGKGVDALQRVVDRFQDEARKRPELAGVFSTYSARVPQLKFDVDRTKARRLDVPIADLFATLQANLGGYYINDFDLYGKVWKVMVQAEGEVRSKPEDIANLYVMNRKGERVPLSSLGEVRYALGPIDVPHYNLYASAKMNGGPAPGFSSGQALVAMQEVANQVLPEGFGYEWTGTTFQEQKTGNTATYIFALSVVCVFLFMAALYESWIRPMVIILTVPLATFGAVVGLWLYDMPLDVFGQIGLVMLIGLETKNAILIVEFGVEMRRTRGMSILESAKAASRERLRPILMTSFAFVMGVLPMARATGAGAYSRNSLGIVIAFGIAVSTILGRFVIPIYYVLGERLIDYFGRGKVEEDEGPSGHHGHQVAHHGANGHASLVGAVPVTAGSEVASGV